MLVNRKIKLKVKEFFRDINIKSIILGGIIGAIFSLAIVESYNYFFETNQDRSIQENKQLIISNKLMNEQFKFDLLDRKYPDIPYAAELFPEMEIFNDSKEMILFRTAVIDGDHYEKENEYHFLDGKIEIGEVEEKGTFFDFLLEPNKVYDITYNISGYYEDTDDIYIDDEIFALAKDKKENIEIDNSHFKSVCLYNHKYDDYTCIVIDKKTEQWISFIYKDYDERYGYNTVRILNSMYSYTNQ